LPALRPALTLAGAWVAAALLAVAAGAPARAADLEARRPKSEPGKACHGADGNASGPGTPSPAGPPLYLPHSPVPKIPHARRKDPQMTPFAASLTDADMADLAAFYAAQRPTPRPAGTDPAKAAAGRELAQQHHCVSCHRPGLVGHEQIPRLAGQDLTYLVK